MMSGMKVAEPRPRTKLAKFIRWTVFLGLCGLVSGVVGGVAIWLIYAPTVPAFASIDDYQPVIGSRIYSADNQLIGEFAAERRVLVPVERIPPHLFQAFISAEDKRFRSHFGVDVLGVAQAVTDKLLHPSSKLRGASTLTQQVAKSLLATRESYAAATERSLRRKLREAILAVRLERTLSKDEILYMYVSQIFLGHKAYGVQAAAEHYFRKNVWELTLAEMATLAGLPQRPSDYSPMSRPKAARARRRYVLGRMLADGYITKEERDAAWDEKLQVYSRRELYLQIAPYFTEQVRREVIERYGERALLEDGLQVYTTVNLQFQHDAQVALRNGLHQLDRRQGFRGPLTHLDKEQRRLFTSRYRAHLGLEENEKISFEDGTLYLAQVTGFEPKGKVVHLDVAGSPGLLPLAGMRWARRPNPTERIDLHYVKDVRHRLRKGDVVFVKRTSRRRLSKDQYGWDAIDSVPKDKDELLFALSQEPAAQGALMSVDPRTGYVIAQVGGYNFEESSFNRATQACREPGSAFKPIVYSAAIDKLDYTASTLIDDKPLVFDDPDNEARWKPNNAGLEFRGALPMRTCLMDSINIPAIRIANAVGIDDIINNARNLGMTTPVKRELGTALGSSCTYLSNLIRVYTTINRYGERQELHFVRKILDRYGNVLEDHTHPSDPTLSFGSMVDRAYARLVEPRERALDRQSTFLTISLMRNVVRGGTATRAQRIGAPVAGKTGTTDDSYDAWFMGFTRNMVTGVWIGHDKKERPLGVSEQGGRTALPVWVEYMSKVNKDYTTTPAKRINDGEFPPPVGVVSARIDPETGLLARPDSRAVSEYYRAGSEPRDYTPDKAVLDPTVTNPWDAQGPL